VYYYLSLALNARAARKWVFMCAREHSLTLLRLTRTQYKGQCWQCGTSHINLWGHWSSPKTPCQPPPDPDDGITAPDDDAQLLGSYNAKTVTGVPEHDQMVANLVDMGVPEAKAVSALECCNFDLIEALTYLEQYG